jgi:hypothetical protein
MYHLKKYMNIIMLSLIANNRSDMFDTFYFFINFLLFEFHLFFLLKFNLPFYVSI